MLVIGTRGSKLALAQAHWVRDAIGSLAAAPLVSVKVVRVAADADPETPIRDTGERGVFVRELDDALLAGDIDLAVHSLKDVPTRIPDGIEISVFPPREDASDAWIAREPGLTPRALPPGARVGTGSLRRQAQLLALRPDLVVADIRGNVDTRLQKLMDGRYDALILAAAGLKRLGLAHRITARLGLDEMIPAPGQGALGIATRRADDAVLASVRHLNDPGCALAVAAERTFLARVGGGCNSPVAVHALPEGGALRIAGLIATPDGAAVIRSSVAAAATEAVAAAAALADDLLARGGRAILAALH